MSYVPDPTDATQPTGVVKASTAAAEFRALKNYIAGLLGLSTSFPSISVQRLNGGQLAGMRNKIINGKMEIAQRGTSFTAGAVNGGYCLDRWVFDNPSAAVGTLSQQADVPSGNEFQSSLRYAVTTADASISAGDLFYLSQRIEGYNVRDLIGRTFTFSFWVRSSKTGVHCVALMNGVADRSYVAEYTISVANTWEFKTITVSGGLITAGTWNWTNGLGLNVGWALASGSTYHTTAGAWQTGNFRATANQVNCLDTIGNIFAITGVQLEVGSVATPFEHRPFGTELALCQRYYEKSAGYGSGVAGFTYGNRGGDGSVLAAIPFRTTKRATPTMTYESFGLTFSGQTVNPDSAYALATGTAPTSAGLNFIASAEL